MTKIVFQVQDHTGHSTEAFDKANPEDLARAHARFNELVGSGHIPAAKTGEQGKHDVAPPSQRVFNPDAQETIFIRPLQGG